MSKILEFPTFAGPRQASLPPTDAEQLLAEFDAGRRANRKRWRQEGRLPEPIARRASIAIGHPPVHDVHAAQLWGFACGLLSLAEQALHVSVRLTGNSDKVLRGYIRTARALATEVEKSETKQRRKRR